MKKTLSLLLALVLSLGLLTESFLVPGRAADAVYFTAVNDQLLELGDATMPFWENGTLYVPGSIFNSSLGISYSYNAAKKLLVLSQNGYRLICNVLSDMIVDSNGVAYTETPKERSGVVFVPLNTVCRAFSLTATTRSVSNGFLVRVRNASAAFSDEGFIDAAASMMNARYAEYEAAHRVTSPDTDSAEEDDGHSFFLALTVEDAAAAEDYMDVFRGTQHRAAFLLGEDFLRNMAEEENAAALRRMLGEGYRLAITSTADIARVHAINEELSGLVYTKTRMLYIEGNGAETMARQGYTVLSGDVRIGDIDLSSVTDITRLLSRISDGSHVLFPKELSAAALRSFLLAAERNTYCAGAWHEE